MPFTWGPWIWEQLSAHSTACGGDEGGWAGPAEAGQLGWPIPAPGALLLSASHNRRACSLKPSKTDANKNEENDLLWLFILSASSGVLFFFSFPQSSLQ